MLEHADERLKELRTVFAEKIPESYRSFEKQVATSVGEALSSDLARLLLSLSFLRRSMEIDGLGLVRSLERSFDQMEEEEAWDSAEKARWEEKKGLLVDLLLADNFVTFEKAVSLSYDYACFLERSRVVTDVRPVFSDDAESIQATIVAQTLQLSYRRRGSGRDV